jgi:hypothetical protein
MITAFVVIDALMERQGARVPDAEIVWYLDCWLTPRCANASGTIAVVRPTLQSGGADGRQLMITAFVVIDALMERQGARVPDAEIVMIAVVATNSDRIKKNLHSRCCTG